MKQLIIVLAISLMLPALLGQALHTRERYVLHPGDVLELNYSLSPQYNQAVTLEPDGHASLNIAGDLKLAGLTMAQAKELIVNGVSSRLKDPDLNLVLKEFQKPYVVVGGQVQSPGKIELRQDMTAMQALLLAGGAKPSAKATKIVLYRKINEEMGEVRTINLNKITKTNQLERDMRLEPGDMLLVPDNKVETFSRYMKAVNFGTFLSPTSF
jgi:polysaccharide export outer membrane protein